MNSFLLCQTSTFHLSIYRHFIPSAFTLYRHPVKHLLQGGINIPLVSQDNIFLSSLKHILSDYFSPGERDKKQWWNSPWRNDNKLELKGATPDRGKSPSFNSKQVSERRSSKGGYIISMWENLLKRGGRKHLFGSNAFGRKSQRRWSYLIVLFSLPFTI